eukprot:m.134381 g.134381  ORF g.134381 m.134381 type:complete len:329 (-) comp13114_c1_seq2:1308-2294(-)
MIGDGFPPFSMDQRSRFDLSTYVGRVKHFYEITDPRTLLKSSPQIEQARDLIQAFKDGKDVGVPNAELWKAKALCDSALHPDTGEEVARPWRFSAFGPVNVPIAAMLLFPSTNPLFVLGSQFINQTYNVLVNYNNRNASSHMSLQTLATAYGAAVTASGGIAIGLGKLASKIKSNTPLMVAMKRAVVPYIALVCAGVVNLALIRQSELTHGVSVYAEDGTELGKSKLAGRDAIEKCALVRALWCIPICLPPFIMAQVEKIPVIRANKRLAFAVELLVIFSCIQIGVPPALAAFPQRDSLPVDVLEEEFRNRTDASGNLVDRVHFNKGL